MDTNSSSNPLHKVLKQIACACLDESMLDEAEVLLHFLDLVGIDPRTIRLIRMWSRCQRGDMQGALRQCNELSEQYPDSEDIEPLQAILRYAVGDRNWRTLCNRILESPTSSVEGKRMATSLLDGTFGKNGTEAIFRIAPEEAQEEPVKDTFDFAIHSAFMRA